MLRALIIAMLLGAATTIAVAWAFAAFNDLTAKRARVSEGQVIAARGGAWVFRSYSEPGLRYVAATHDPELTAGKSTVLPPVLARLDPETPRIPIRRTLQRPQFICERAAGWPLLALAAAGYQTVDPTTGESVESVELGLPLGEDTPSSTRTGRAGVASLGVDDFRPALPLRPLWGGFALNTLAYGGLWFLWLLIRKTLRRRALIMSIRLAVATVAVALLLGALATVIAAWICAWCVDESASRNGSHIWAIDSAPDDATGGRWLINIQDVPGAARMRSYFSIRGFLRPFSGEGDARELWPAWARYGHPPRQWIELDASGEYVVAADALSDTEAAIDEWGPRIVDARGWPFLSMWSGVRLESGRDIDFSGMSDRGRPMEVVGGWIEDPDGDPRHDVDLLRRRLFPLRPIWPGFALNTVLFAVPASVLVLWIIGPKSVLRAIRRRRGLCPRCAYPISRTRTSPATPVRARRDASGCPECGWGMGQGDCST